MSLGVNPGKEMIKQFRTLLLSGVPMLALGLINSHNARPTASPTCRSAVAIDAPLVLPLASPRIVVKKHLRRLLLFSGSRLVRAYAIGLGANPTDDKTREGDGCTPEGRFYIAAKNPHSHYFRSLQISYPGTMAAARALKEKHIDVTQYRQIVRAIRAQGVPPQNTPLGGQVFIHGGGSNSNWTLGCVALENKAMRELYSAAPKGTPVLIEH